MGGRVWILGGWQSDHSDVRPIGRIGFSGLRMLVDAARQVSGIAGGRFVT